jgi:hypothetical protein
MVEDVPEKSGQKKLVPTTLVIDRVDLTVLIPSGPAALPLTISPIPAAHTVAFTVGGKVKALA